MRNLASNLLALLLLIAFSMGVPLLLPGWASQGFSNFLLIVIILMIAFKFNKEEERP